MGDVRIVQRLAVAAGIATAALFGGLQVAPAFADEPAGKSRLAFVNGSRIFAIDADGSDRQALTFRAKTLGEYEEEFDRAPRVSPDGSRFLFFRDADYDRRGEFTKLMVASMDGSRARTVTTSVRLSQRKTRFVPDVDLKSAAWSRDGKRIVFTQEDTKYRFRNIRRISRIRSIKPNGTGLRTLATSRVSTSGARGMPGRGSSVTSTLPAASGKCSSPGSGCRVADPT